MISKRTRSKMKKFTTVSELYLTDINKLFALYASRIIILAAISIVGYLINN